MKKIIYLTIALLAAPVVCGATEYWLGGVGAGSMDGSSEPNMFPFSSLATVKATLVNAGDTVHICGNNTYDTYNPSTNVLIDWTTPSGSAGSTINIDGLCNDPGIIDARSDIPAFATPATWTNHSGNVWYMSTSGWADYSESVIRLWANGSELLKANAVVDADVTEITASKWGQNTTEHKLYVYSTENPATAFTSMTGLQDVSITVRFMGVGYIDLHDIEIYGGYSSNVAYQYSTHSNLYDSVVKNGRNAVQITGNAASPYQESSYINIFSSELVGYDSSVLSYEAYTYDGILIISGSNCKIFSNAIKDFGHAGVYIYASNTNLIGAVDNEVYLNDISSPSQDYGRPFAIDGHEAGGGGVATGNKFYLNNVHDYQVRSQINGYENEVTHSIFAHARNSTSKAYGTAQGIYMSVYGATLVSHDNLFYNLTFIDLDEPAIRVKYDQAATYGHVFKNIMAVDTGVDSIDGMDDIAVRTDDSADVYGLTFANCDFYNEGVTNVISYRGTAMDVATFNAADAESDTITDNYQVDPVLDTQGRPALNSPVIDAGTDVGLPYWGAAPEIGAYEVGGYPIKINNIPYTMPIWRMGVQ